MAWPWSNFGVLEGPKEKWRALRFSPACPENVSPKGAKTSWLRSEWAAFKETRVTTRVSCRSPEETALSEEMHESIC